MLHKDWWPRHASRYDPLSAEIFGTDLDRRRPNPGLLLSLYLDFKPKQETPVTKKQNIA